MTSKKYQPTKSFQANKQKIMDILKEINEEMKKTHNVCSILLSIVINPEGSTEAIEIVKTYGDIHINLLWAFGRYQKEVTALNPKRGERTH